MAAGDDREDVNIVSQFGRVVRVDGTAVGPNGEPVQMSVGIADLATRHDRNEHGRRAGNRGAFLPDVDHAGPLAAVRPRRAARNASPDAPYPWWGQLEITTATENITGVVMTFAPGSVVTGRLVFQGTQPQPDLAKARISLTHLPTIAGTGVFIPPVTPKPDGSFVFKAVPPGKYRVGISALGAWALKSATNSARDTLDTPLEIAPGDAPALARHADGSARRKSPACSAINSIGRRRSTRSSCSPPIDRTGRRRLAARSGLVRLASDGTYRVTGLPAGNYLLTVVTDIEPGLLNDASFLDQLARSAVPVTLAEGEKKRQDFRIKYSQASGIARAWWQCEAWASLTALPDLDVLNLPLTLTDRHANRGGD